MSYASKGFAEFAQRSGHIPPTPPGTPAPPRPGVKAGGCGCHGKTAQPSTGYVTPSQIFGRQKAIDQSALELNTAVIVNLSGSVPATSFILAWSNWYTRWQQFYAQWQTPAQKTTALLMSDELDATTEGYRQQLEQFRATYPSQLKADGSQTAPLVGPSLPVPPPKGAAESPEAPGTGLPWWGISVLTLGGLALLAGGGYATYRYVQETRHKKKWLEEKVVPALVGSHFGEGAVELAKGGLSHPSSG